MGGTAVKYFLLFITCECWFGFYTFLNSYVRTLKLCIEMFESIGSSVMKILFLIFMFLFGCHCIQLIFCLFGIVYLFQGSCEEFAGNGDIYDGYHKLVYKSNYPIEGSIRDILKSNNENKQEAQKKPNDYANPSQWDSLGFLLEELKQKNQNKKVLLPPQDPKYNGKLTVIVELDDILVHTFQPDEHEAYLNAPLRDHDFYFELKEYDTYVSVYKRPYLDDFLKYLRENTEAILFTKGVKEYCTKVLELIDPNKSFAYVLTNEDCDRVTYEQEDMDEYIKDLERLGRDMKKLIYIDSQPISFWTAPDNAMPINSYFGELNNDDTTLQDIQENLDYLSKVEDVREYLKEEFQIREVLKQSRFL